MPNTSIHRSVRTSVFFFINHRPFTNFCGLLVPIGGSAEGRRLYRRGGQEWGTVKWGGDLQVPKEALGREGFRSDGSAEGGS